MNTIRTAVAALLIAGSTFVAFAFTKADKNVNKEFSQTQLHWFDPDGNYLGQKTIAEQEAECPGAGNVCARGYNGVNGGNPVGSVIYTATRN